MGQQEGQSRTAPSYLKIISQPRLKQNRYAGLFRAYAYPGTVPGGYPQYPDPQRGGFLTVVVV